MNKEVANSIQINNGEQFEFQKLVLLALPWLLAAILLVSNLMTLLNDRFNSAAHETLERLAAMVAIDTVRSAVLQRSPEAVLKRKVIQATQQTKEENERLRARHSDLDRQYQQLKTRHIASEKVAARRISALGKFAASTILRAGRN